MEMMGGGGEFKRLPKPIWAFVHSNVIKGDPFTRYLSQVESD